MLKPLIITLIQTDKHNGQVINLMKNEGFNKTAFEEMRAMAELEEIYSNKGEGANRAINLANETLFYPIEDAGRINYIYEENLLHLNLQGSSDQTQTW